MRKVIVTGGAGFIGTNLCRSALQKGIEVVVVDNLARKGTELNLRFLEQQPGKLQVIRGDVRDYKAMKELFARHGDAGAVFHFAGQVAVTTSVVDPRTDFEVNLLGTVNVLEAMRECRVSPPLIYSSTNKVYGGLEHVAVREFEKRYEFADLVRGVPESMQLDFHSPYGCSKGGADQYVIDYARIYGFRTVTFRQSCIYGYHQFGHEDQGWVAWFTIAAMLGHPITVFGNGKQVRDVLFIDDLIAAYWAALDRIDQVAGKVYNMGGGPDNQISLLELLAHLSERLGRKVTPKFEGPRPGDQPIFICDIGKAKAELGWKPAVGVIDGTNRLIDWISANRALFAEAGMVR